jgi:hypothetical protein
MTQYREVEIAELAATIVKHLEPDDRDPMFKAAALRAAAASMEQAATMRATLLSFAKTLGQR